MDAQTESPDSTQLQAAFAKLRDDLSTCVIGQPALVERLLIALLADGHLLVEGAPGLAKTTAIKELATRIEADFHRLQFTPDLLPSDLTGTDIYRPQDGRFEFQPGPLFHNLLLADEINRAPAKVQSALLEVMAEHHVTIGGQRFDAPEPFLVLATQNPIESEGVYPLPEAQRDRFLMKVLLDYPAPAEEVEIVQRMGTNPPHAEQALTLAQVEGLQAAAEEVFVDRSVLEYAVNLVLCTRTPENFGLPELRTFIELGASPRASLGLIRGGRALALLRGRNYLTPQDVFDVAPEIMRHRMLLSYEALAQDVDVEQVLARVLGTVPAPRLSPTQGGGDAYYGTSTDAGAWNAPAASGAAAAWGNGAS